MIPFGLPPSHFIGCRSSLDHWALNASVVGISIFSRGWVWRDPLKISLTLKNFKPKVN
jgi:hypothetical protein